MKDKLNSLLESAKNVGALIQEKATAVGQVAVENTLQAIEKWLEEIPKIQSYGMQVANFTFNMGLSPALEIDLKGQRADFSPERLTTIVTENKNGSLAAMVFGAVRTAFRLHEKIADTTEETFFVKIRLSLSPEIAVFIGKPRMS